MKPKESAKIALTAIHSFASQSPKHLKEIIFIIYQGTMMKDFKQAVKSFNVDKPGSLWSSIKGNIYCQFSISRVLISQTSLLYQRLYFGHIVCFLLWSNNRYLKLRVSQSICSRTRKFTSSCH